MASTVLIHVAHSIGIIVEPAIRKERSSVVSVL